MKINSKIVALLIIVVLLGGVLILIVSGLWITEGKKVPTKITTGEFVGTSNPADIKGSYSLLDIETYYGVPSETIASAFLLDTSVMKAVEYKAKDIEEVYQDLGLVEGDIGTDSIRYFVSLYLEIPYVAEEDTILPLTAVNLLYTLEKISDEQYATLSERSFNPSGINVMINTTTDVVEETTTQDMVVKGNTTFNDVISWGVPQSEIERVLGVPIGGKNTIIKDFATSNGVEFSLYKGKLQTLIDSL